MNQEFLADVQQALAVEGPENAIERLCAGLRERKDYAALFYALLLKKRHELGVSLVPGGSAEELPEAAQAPYEDAIREAGRLVGRLYLEEGDIPRAWVYFRMLGEPAPVAAAFENLQPKEDDDVQPLVDIAFNQGVNPRRGFDLILERYGLCNAITTLGGQLPQSAEVRTYCIHRLVHSLYDELLGRLKAEIAHKEGKEPPEPSVPALVAGRDWLFQEECYHIDISHLGAVVQMSVHLTPGPELNLARELCAYGRKLGPRLQYPGDPPFEDRYRDFGVYLDILAGDQVAEGLAHFHAKVENADPEEVGTIPAEVLVDLLLRLDRPAEALAVARRRLAAADQRMLSCPGIAELCRRAGDYRTLAEVAREQGDAVQFLAGLLEVED